MNTDYGRNHRNRVNLLIHILAVPLFVASALSGAFLVIRGEFLAGAFCLLGLPLSLALQGYGHRLEEISPEPFTGPANFVRRIFTEQFYGFWAYLFSGRWLRALRAAR